MDNIYTYVTKLPDGLNEMILPCLDGYTVYIDDRLSDLGRMEAYNHAITHIRNRDWEKNNIQEIEMDAHYAQKNRSEARTTPFR